MAIALTGAFGCTSDPVTEESDPKSEKNLAIWPTITSEVAQDAAIEKKVADLLASMTLEQKVAQMIQPEIRDITVEDMRKYGFGSYLNGGGAFPNNNKHSTPQDWIALAEDMYQASIDDSLDGSKIPTMWGTDAVHGHNNVIGATLFPHNIGLGAANNPELIEKIAQITATEVMVTGIDWVFAPTVATVRDDRWGRTYEGYSEDPEIVRTYASSIVKGLQGHAGKNFLGDDRVISTVKHFIGDGGTVDGDDQGNNISSEQELFDIHAQGYVGGLTAGAQSVMASFNSWHGEKVHGNGYLLTDVLKNKMGFDGFVVGDWNGHGQVKGCSNESCPQAVNAGLDIYMVPTDAWKPLYHNTIAQVKDGTIKQSRIDDAVTRILRVKFRAGLFDKPSPAKRQFSGKTELIGQASHRQVAEQAVRESLVLLKNKENLLPLSPKQHILIAGDAADNIGKQSGGWTITWQGTNNQNSDFPGGSSIYDGLAQQINAAGGKVTLSEKGQYTDKPDVAIVVFGEEPYAEGQGDIADLVYQKGHKSDLQLLKSLQAQNIPVVAVFISGRPMWVNAELNASDAFVAAWLPGSEGKAVADVLLSDSIGKVQHDFVGKLSFSWPQTADQIVNRFDDDYQPLLPYGFGLRYGDDNVLADNLSEQYQANLDSEQTVKVFAGQVAKPWKMQLFSEHEQQDVVASNLLLPGIHYRTIDKEVQEDAFRLTVKSDAPVGIQFVSDKGVTLNAESAQSSRLTLNVKRESDVAKPVLVSMQCQQGESGAAGCQLSHDISAQLSALPLDTWTDIGIDLNCLSKNASDFNQISQAFKLSTQGSLSLSISGINIVPANEDASTSSCN
ncbi:glycoside hydrolase family 3 N-terminal domain-containing protein [Thalassotalea sp. PLHSN55]|uniref:glycoside hydrolase family 3 protein n=1 Tax=Thalassotalea sp. PLHSN55 TaxID=3435888 RepID=UPI003F87494D